MNYVEEIVKNYLEFFAFGLDFLIFSLPITLGVYLIIFIILGIDWLRDRKKDSMKNA